MATLPDQLTALRNDVTALRALLNGSRERGLFFALLGDRCVYGCKITEGTSSADMYLSLDGQATGDASNLNPYIASPAVRHEEYPNIALVYGEVFESENVNKADTSDDSLLLSDAPGTAGYGRYDIVYVYVGNSGPAIAIADGTASTACKTDYDTNGLDISAFGSTYDPAIPTGALAIARVYVEYGDTGIGNARIADIRSFATRGVDVDIDGGTIDGVTVGGSVQGAGTFTALTADSSVTFGDGATAGNRQMVIDAAAASAAGVILKHAGGTKWILQMDGSDETLYLYDSSISKVVSIGQGGVIHNGGRSGGGIASSAVSALFDERVEVASGGSFGYVYVTTEAADADGLEVGRCAFASANQSGAEKRIAEIAAFTQGATAGDRGGKLVFRTGADAGSAAIDRLAINNEGQSTFTRNGNGLVQRYDNGGSASGGVYIGSSTVYYGDISTNNSFGVTPGSNNAGVWTNGQKRLEVNSAGSAYCYGDVYLQSSSPTLYLTDTDTGADCKIDGTSGAGSLYIGADINNESASSALIFELDGSEVGRFATGGWFGLNATAGSFHRVYKPGVKNQGDVIMMWSGDGSVADSMFVYDVGANSANGAATALSVGQNSSTSRSINAGGTINASGADYAEYERLADTVAHGTFSAGDLVGFDANGLLTDRYADAVSFGVKSTNPNLVGGDSWGDAATLGLVEPEPPPAAEYPGLVRPVYNGVAEPTAPAVGAFVPPEYIGSLEPVLPPENATQEELDAYAAALAQYDADQLAYADIVATAEASHLDAVAVAEAEYADALAAYDLDQAAYVGEVSAAEAAYADVVAAIDAEHAAAVAQYEADRAAFDTALEEARQRVDRVAYCGKVPVNVTAEVAAVVAPGEWIVPVDDGAGGIAAGRVPDAELTFAEFRAAVGRVRSIGDDGRPIVAVGVN